MSKSRNAFHIALVTTLVQILMVATSQIENIYSQRIACAFKKLIFLITLWIHLYFQLKAYYVICWVFSYTFCFLANNIYCNLCRPKIWSNINNWCNIIFSTVRKHPLNHSRFSFYKCTYVDVQLNVWSTITFFIYYKYPHWIHCPWTFSIVQ